MKSRPIIFSAQMIQALLDGRKTQTRRIIKPRHGGEIIAPAGPGLALEDIGVFDGTQHITTVECPYGQIGDELWVRETWRHSNYPSGPLESDCLIFYRADYFDDPHGPDGEMSPEGRYRFWQSPIYMPKWASRFTLTITDIRVQRLQDISDEDSTAEGCTWIATAPRSMFRSQWEQINGRGSWDANPWVWALSFSSEVKP